MLAPEFVGALVARRRSAGHRWFAKNRTYQDGAQLAGPTISTTRASRQVWRAGMPRGGANGRADDAQREDREERTAVPFPGAQGESIIVYMPMKSALTSRIFALALAFTATGSRQEPVARISTAEADGYVGRTATVCGRVVSIDCPPDDSRALIALDGPYPKGVRVAITAFDRAAFGPRVGHLFLQQVCATGRIESPPPPIFIAWGPPLQRLWTSPRFGERAPSVRGPGVRTGVHVWSTPSQLLVQEPRTLVPAAFGEAYTQCDQGVTVPSVVHEVRPIYTAEAMRRKVNGTVLLNAVVLPTGRVGDVVVAVSLDKEFGLDDEAVKALKDWRFEPGTKEGRPVPVIVSVEMTMNIA